MADLHVMLGAFLADLGRRRWQWGVTDCLMVPADWIKATRGFDPAEPFRGAYDDEASCVALLTRAGGLVRLVTQTLASAGLSQTTSPKPGDFAVIKAPCRRRGVIVPRHTGAIVMGGGKFAVMTSDLGVLVAPFKMRMAWSV